MVTAAAIVAAITAVFASIPIFSKYFPAKTDAEKKVDLDKKLADEAEARKETGRP